MKFPIEGIKFTIEPMRIIITKHMTDTEIVVHKKERLKNLKVIQEKADVKSYGVNHFINKGRPMQPTMKMQNKLRR